MKELTQTEKLILDSIKELTKIYRQPPTLTEISKATSKSIYLVWGAVNTLVSNGLLSRTPGRHRSIVVVDACTNK